MIMKVMTEEEAKRFKIIKAAAEKLKGQKAHKIRNAIEEKEGYPTAIPRI